MSLNTNRIIDVSDPSGNQDAATKYYVDTAVGGSLTEGAADIRYYLNTTTLDNIATAAANVAFAGFKLTNIGNAVANTDALNL